MKYIIFFILILRDLFVAAQPVVKNTDSLMLQQIYKTSLLEGKSYVWLDHLSNQIGGRLSGSIHAERAVDWAKKELEQLGLDRVWLQEVMVPKWTRGVPEYAYIETAPGKTNIVPICALGGSVPTPSGGLKAKVVEVKGLEELEVLGQEKIAGKIVFYNRPMQADLINTMQAYNECVEQQYSGAEMAAKYGALGVIVRSMNLRLDDFPHTGSMNYGALSGTARIPAAAISTNGAELLSAMVALNPDIQFYFSMSCKNWKDVPSYNVIAEKTGTTFPKEYMVVGGHLDSWDLGDGSHDDGAGVVQSMEVLRLFKKVGYQPKRSIRVVLFMNEENGLRGAKKYAEVAREKGENHVFALESAHGGFSPRGFDFDCTSTQLEKIRSWKPLFAPYYLHHFSIGDSGTDVRLLKKEGVILSGLRLDSQRYFEHHHSQNDTFDAVNKRELELGAASMAALMYLVDKYHIN